MLLHAHPSPELLQLKHFLEYTCGAVVEVITAGIAGGCSRFQLDTMIFPNYVNGTVESSQLSQGVKILKHWPLAHERSYLTQVELPHSFSSDPSAQSS